MYVILFVFGIIATAAGVAMVGFGIPINEFGLGNTLILAGTSAIVGGLILIGLADAVRQLRRIAESLMARPSPRMSRSLDPFEPAAPAQPRTGIGQVPFPRRPKGERPPGSGPLEPRLEAAPSIAGEEGGFDRPPSFPSMPGAAQPRSAPERDEDRWSPEAPSVRTMEARIGLMDIIPEPRGIGIVGEPTPAEETMPISGLDSSQRPAPAADAPAPQSELFDSLWPSDSRAGKTRESDASEAAMSEAKVDSEAGDETEQDRAETPAEPHAVSILKSGVVDGMAYTLYSDGSIEAEMPQGTMRFASLGELRAYLDKSA